MTLRRASRRAAVAAALVATLALAGCSTRAPEAGGGGGGGGQVTTDVGVSADTITLGVLSDTSGPFRNLGTGLVQGNQLWVDDINARGGICGRKIALDVQDSGYKADVATTVYRQQQPQILGYLQLLGSPINAALRGNLESDQVTSLALSWSSIILDNPYQIIPGTTYDLEMINGLRYLQDQGLIADGDTLGHIYIGGEYGENGLRGAQYYAQQHGMTIQPAKIASTDTDMAGIVTGFQGAGVKAILLTSTPAQTNSVLNATTTLGLDVPKAKEVREKFVAKFPDAQKNYGVPYGYAGGLVWEQILTGACQAGDLTRAGVHKAFTSSESITTDNLVASELDFSKPGSPPSRSVYLAVADPSQEGGLRQVTEPFTAAEAESYKAPHEWR